ncbi:MAG: hypothetical protein MK033_12320 [Candidatus Caenarcaniphilales bacterium]|nr:hypothetical protein [Candidatus Caenarcaniphilales bacterium]
MNSQEIKYEKYIVSFIDILGWGEIIKTKNAEEIYKIHKYFSMFLADVQELNSIRENAITLQFSDSMICMKKVKEEHQSGVLFDQINDLLRFQMELAGKNILIRGGITVGDLFIEKSTNTYFGPAWNQAYYLESEIAKQPRIIIDNDLIEDFNSHTSSYAAVHHMDYPEMEQEYINSMLTYDIDEGGSKVFFIDYIEGAVNGEADEEMIIPFLEKHRKYIIETLNSSDIQDCVRKKFEWLKSYYNKKILRLIDEFKYLLIQ